MSQLDIHTHIVFVQGGTEDAENMSTGHLFTTDLEAAGPAHSNGIHATSEAFQMRRLESLYPEFSEPINDQKKHCPLL